MNTKTLTNLMRNAMFLAMAAVPAFSACTYSISVPAISAAGGVVPAYVNTQSGCAWQVTPTGSFLTRYSNWQASGPGVAYLYAQPDRAAARNATVYLTHGMTAQDCGGQIGGRSSTCVVGSMMAVATTTATQY